MNNNTIYIQNKVSVRKKKATEVSASEEITKLHLVSYHDVASFFLSMDTPREYERCSVAAWALRRASFPLLRKALSILLLPDDCLSLNNSPPWQGCALSEPEPNDRYRLFMWKAHLTRVCLIQKLKGLKRCVRFGVWHGTKIAGKDNKGSGRQFGESCPASIKLENLIGSWARRISQFWLSFSSEWNQLSFTLSFGSVLFLPQLVFYLCF